MAEGQVVVQESLTPTRPPKFRGEYSSVHYLPSSDIIEGDTASVFRVPYVYDSGAWWKKD